MSPVENERDGNAPGDVRGEDAVDVAAVASWALEHATLPQGWSREELAGTPRVQQFAGGASNLTYLLRYPTRDVVLRRPPLGRRAAAAHDMGREHRVQRALQPLFPYVPAMLGHCDDEDVIGAEFYLMERLEGTVLRRDLPDGITPGEASTLCGRALDVLVELHAVDVTAAPDLAALGRGEGYVARQLDGWTRRFEAARTEDTGSWEDVVGWLSDHRPEDVGQCLIHNDFRLDNLVLDLDGTDGAGPRVTGVLDWELATVGDPLMDLGGALAYWVQADDDAAFRAARRQPSDAPGMWTRAELVAGYAERTGRSVDPDAWRFYEVFGLFRLAVIAQQIWVRYVRGQTTNPAFADIGRMVAVLEHRCRRLVAEAG